MSKTMPESFLVNKYIDGKPVRLQNTPYLDLTGYSYLRTVQGLIFMIEEWVPTAELEVWQTATEVLDSMAG